MSDTISLPKLTQMLATKRPLIEEAIKVLHQGTETPMSLALIELAGAGAVPPLRPVDALIEYLVRNDIDDTFVRVLQKLGEDVAGEEFLPDFDPIAANSFDPQEMTRFCTQAAAFRCRIEVNGQIKGSGVLVSHRLVLTAWHVVNQPNPWAGKPDIEIIASDGKRYRARLAGPRSDIHPKEWTKIVALKELANHSDYVLLRLDEPIGYSLGYMEVPDAAPKWPGSVQGILVHYPHGADRGFTGGEVKYGGKKPRYTHKIPTVQGSSGGAAFSNKFEFIGLHQGTVGQGKRLVPATLYLSDSSFRNCLGADSKPHYLWSLNRSLDAHLIIGRSTFFQGIDAVLGGQVPIVGLWIKRTDPQQDVSGLSFSFRMLENFLGIRAPEAKAVRVEIPIDGSDLLDLVALATGEAGQVVGRPGVLADQTTLVSSERDRADALVGALDQRGVPIWIYLEGPSQEFSQRTQQQLEQLVARLARAKHLRLVLSRLESYPMPVPTYQSVSIPGDSKAGLLIEYLGTFTEADVRLTVRTIGDDLGVPLDAVLDSIVEQALAGVPKSFGVYQSSLLEQVSATLAGLIRPRIPA